MMPLQRNFILGCVIFLCAGGCQTASQRVLKPEEKETAQALKAIAESVGGQELTDQQFKDLQRDIENDPQTKSAVEAISNSLSNPVRRVKYCPDTGERFSAHLEYCPGSNTKLKWVEE